MSYRPQWSEPELAKLRREYPVGGVAGVIAAGVKRSETAIRWKASVLGIGASPAVGGRCSPLPPLMLPGRPASVTTRLVELAESRPTPAEYDRCKAEILGGSEC